MISQYEEPERRSTPKGSALAKLMRRTVPEDISRDPVLRSTSLRNRPARAQRQPEISIQQQPEASILQPPSRDSSDYDSDGEPKLPPPSIGRELPTDFKLRFWDKSPNQAPSTGKKRKPSRETIETYFPRHQMPKRVIGQPIDNPNIIEDPEFVQQPDRREKLKLCGALEAQLSRLQDDMRQLEQTLKDLQSTGDNAQFDDSRLQKLLQPLLLTFTR
ncbi:hypothetical protein KEM56_001979 [Ascosphaera pollenicola]|nr:hypothetical protein KEM56_001979 [Ascosphaera pollenicola]